VSAFSELEAGDFLFIDSTHVVKAESDVVWLFLHVLPHLKPGVIVHVHDILWPFEYPEEWLRERRDWTEGYLVHAFLAGNAEWEILLFSSWLWQCHPELAAGKTNTDLCVAPALLDVAADDDQASGGPAAAGYGRPGVQRDAPTDQGGLRPGCGLHCAADL
jgi:hypothetical protein